MTTTTATRERPIIFSAPMVRALLDGRKTQTRRLVKPSNSTVDGYKVRGSHWAWKSLDFDKATARDKATIMVALVGPDAAPPDLHLRVPRPEEESFHRVRCDWEEGDRLWVKEKHRLFRDYPDAAHDAVFYAADNPENPDGWKWRPSIHLPRRFARITLEIVSVRVERVQEINEADAVAEGMPEPRVAASVIPSPIGLITLHDSRRHVFELLWDMINGAGSWASNPWVWAVEFRRLTP